MTTLPMKKTPMAKKESPPPVVSAERVEPVETSTPQATPPQVVYVTVTVPVYVGETYGHITNRCDLRVLSSRQSVVLHRLAEGFNDTLATLNNGLPIDSGPRAVLRVFEQIEEQIESLRKNGNSAKD